MSYFKIDNIDYSQFVSGLKVSKAANYSAITNAAGNTVVDYINSKRTIEVSIIPLNDTDMKNLKTAIDKFNVKITYREPMTNDLTTIDAILPDDKIEYYTIQVDKVMYKAMTLTFTEL